MRVTIKKMGINGEGIGYIDRLPVFVPGALLNEEAEIKVIERTQRYARAKVEKIIKRSDKRVRPACGIQHRCGACPYMVCADEERLRFKRDNLRQSLIKYAQIDPKLISEVRPSPAQAALPQSVQASAEHAGRGTGQRHVYAQFQHLRADGDMPHS
ncbi:MAG: TRAM domain-containing protein [Merdibacter sp.]